jgi:hypothetical protein
MRSPTLTERRYREGVRSTDGQLRDRKAERSGTNRAERDSLHLCSLKGVRGGARQIASISDLARRERMEMRGKPKDGCGKGEYPKAKRLEAASTLQGPIDHKSLAVSYIQRSAWVLRDVIYLGKSPT